MAKLGIKRPWILASVNHVSRATRLPSSRLNRSGSELAQSDGVVQLLLRMTLPPGGYKSVVEALRSVMLPARLERGCTRAQILGDVDAAESIDYFEEWQSAAGMNARIRSESFGRLLSLMEAAPSAPSTLAARC